MKLDFLKDKEKKELDKIIHESKDNPEKIAEEMSKMFGIKNV